MSVFLTLSELYVRRGSQAAVEALVSGAEDLLQATETALDNAEREAVRELSKRYILPTSPETTPKDLKALIAAAFIYHARRLSAPQAKLEDEWEGHKKDVLDVYRNDQVQIGGLILKTETGGSGVAVAPPARRPIALGAFDELWRRAG